MAKQELKSMRNSENMNVSFLGGKFGKEIYDLYDELRKTKFSNNPNLKSIYHFEIVTGGSLFDSFLIDSIVKEKGYRIASLQDYSDKRVIEMMAGKTSLTAPAAVLRSEKDISNKDNDGLIRKLLEYVDIKRKPALIDGLDVIWSDREYGLQLVPNEEFNLLYDERLLGKYNKWKFDEVDEFGLPMNLDENKGNRTWYTRDDRLSRFALCEFLDLNSGHGNLVNSYDGAIILLGGEVNDETNKIKRPDIWDIEFDEIENLRYGK